jgi:tetratricopeptide (TPR) repeat protein
VLTLGAFTSVFVLVVLPQRFVLQAGLIESGITFPTAIPPFLTPPQPRVVQPQPTPPIRPGPAERFWNTILPMLRAGKFEQAVPEFRTYLATQPDDPDILRELAVVLTRLERYDEAEEIYVRLRATSDDPRPTLQLARLRRDRGQPERSLDLYRDLLDLRPDDRGLLREYAQALTWSEQYAEAAEVYRRLLSDDPSAHDVRLEYAKVLYWDGRQVEAMAALAALPDDSPQATEAAELRSTLEQELASTEAPDTPLERARRAVVQQDFDEAARLYGALLAQHPNDPELWLEWANFLQYQQQDMVGARDALSRLATLRDLTWDERFRHTQLHVWTGEEAQARTMLLGLLHEDSTNSAGWALLGDLYRFDDARLRSRRAYRTAFALDPQNVRALEGRRELERQATQLVRSRERPSAGPECFYFRDSDGFERLDIGARATFQLNNTVVVARAGYRMLDGTALAGTPGTEKGPYFQLEFAHWWRLGTIRTSVTAGLEQLDAFGTEPTFAAKLALPDASGTAVEIAYEHGPAFHRTVTLESVLAIVRSDHMQASIFRQFGSGWSFAGLGGVTSLRGGGTDTWRFNAFATLRRQIAAPFSIALTSQALAFSSAAPVLQSRRLYWDPSTFWAAGLQIEARTRSVSDWELYGRVTPGVGLVRERVASGFEFVPQLSTEAGAAYESRRIAFSAGLAYLRGREGAYNSFGANVSLGIKY